MCRSSAARALSPAPRHASSRRPWFELSYPQVLPLMFRHRIDAAATVAAVLCALGPAWAENAAVRIVLVGDSTVNDQGGWGPGLRASLGPGVEVLNLAKNGR